MTNPNQSEYNLPPPAENIQSATRDQVLNALNRIKQANNLTIEKQIIDPRFNDWVIDENATNGPIENFDILNLPDQKVLKIGWSINDHDKTQRRELLINPDHTAIVIRAGAQQDRKAPGAGDVWIINLKDNSARVFTGWFPQATDTSPSPSP